MFDQILLSTAYVAKYRVLWTEPAFPNVCSQLNMSSFET